MKIVCSIYFAFRNGSPDDLFDKNMKLSDVPVIDVMITASKNNVQNNRKLL